MTDATGVAAPDWRSATELPRLHGATTARQAMRDNFPDHPLATDDPRSGCWRQTRYDALERAYISPNDAKLKRWIVVDVDHEDPIDWEELQIPAPYAEVSNRWDGRRHLLWMLACPVSTGPLARPRPQAWRDAIQARLTAACGGDAAYGEGLCKTPGHPRWATTIGCPVAWSLAGLDAATEAHKGHAAQRKAPKGAQGSRNVALFDALRARAYRAKAEGSCASYSAFLGQISATAHAIAPQIARALGKPTLRFGEVAGCARSVARWTWARYSGTARETAFQRRASRMRLYDPRLFEVHIAWAAHSASIGESRPGAGVSDAARRASGRAVQASLDQVERALAAYRAIARAMGRTGTTICAMAIARILRETAMWARRFKVPPTTLARLMRRLRDAPGAPTAPRRIDRAAPARRVEPARRRDPDDAGAPTRPSVPRVPETPPS